MATAAELAAVFRLRDEFSDQAGRIEQRLGGLEDRLGVGLSRAAVVGGAGVAVLLTTLAAVGERAFALGSAFDEAYDRIRAGTGATGEALASLEASFRSVAGDVPASFESVSRAITELHQRLDLTGASLEQRSAQFLNLARLTGGDLSESIRSGARAFQEWKIETDAQGDALDQLFRASQLTGESTSTLFEQLRGAGPTLRQLGYGFEESLAQLAKWDKEGVDSERIMAALRVGLANLSESGLPIPETFRAIVQQIGSLDDVAASTGLAIQVFGRRAGPELAEAIRAGRFDISEMFDTITNGSDTIQQAVQDTDDAAQRWQITSNRMALAFEPVGTAVFETANKVAEHLLPAFEEWAREAAPLVQGSADLIIGSFDAVGQAADRLVDGIGVVKRAFEQGIQTPELPTPESRTVPGPLGGNAEEELRRLYGGRGLSSIAPSVAEQIESGVPEAQASVERSADEVVASFYGRISELFTQSLAEARLRTSLGASGAALATALQNAWEKPLDAAARAAVASAEAALEEEIRKTFGAERAGQMSAQLQGLVTGALAGGAESDQAGATQRYLQGLRGQIDAQTQANRELEAAQREAQQRARQAAEAAQREAERMAQAHADLLRQYARTAEQYAPEIERAYGEIGARARTALDEALLPGAGGGAGQSLARALTDLAHQAREAGLPAWEETWRELVDVGQRAIEEGTPGARQAAEEMIRQVNDAIRQQNTLTRETFAQAFDVAELRSTMGSQGAAIGDALAKGLQEGGRASVQQLGQTVESLRTTLLNNSDLSPERAYELFRQVFARVSDAIDDGSDEAIAGVRAFLRDFDLSTGLEAITTRASEQMRRAIESSTSQITQAYASRDEQIKRLYTNLAIQQFDRSQQEAEQAWIDQYLADTQKYVEGEKAKIAANRDRAQSERAELRETADLEKAYQEQRDALLKKAQDTASANFGANPNSAGAQRLRQAAEQGILTGARQVPGDQLAQQLRDLDSAHTKDMANLAARQAQRRADHAEDLQWAEQDKTAYERVAGVLTAAQQSARTISQDWRDTYQLNVTIPRQVNDLMTSTAENVAKINTSLSTQMSQYLTDEQTALTRWQYLHDTTLPELQTAFDGLLDGSLKDAQTWHDLVVDTQQRIAAAGGTSNAGKLPTPPPPATPTAPVGGYYVSRGPNPPEPPPVEPPAPPSPDVTVNVNVQGSVVIPDLDQHIVDTVQQAQRVGTVV